MFVCGVFEDNNSVVHIGEIHLYFDIVKNSSIARFVGSSFYGNYHPLKVDIDSDRLKYMTHILKYLLTSKYLLQIKFPISDHLFKNTNELFTE
jgi:hypothetical protein